MIVAGGRHHNAAATFACCPRTVRRCLKHLFKWCAAALPSGLPDAGDWASTAAAVSRRSWCPVGPAGFIDAVVIPTMAPTDPRTRSNYFVGALKKGLKYLCVCDDLLRIVAWTGGAPASVNDNVLVKTSYLGRTVCQLAVGGQTATASPPATAIAPDAVTANEGSAASASSSSSSAMASSCSSCSSSSCGSSPVEAPPPGRPSTAGMRAEDTSDVYVAEDDPDSDSSADEPSPPPAAQASIGGMSPDYLQHTLHIQKGQREQISAFLERLPDDLFFLGDSAFAASSKIVKPFDADTVHALLSPTELMAFNFLQSSLRQRIEQAFGYLHNMFASLYTMGLTHEETWVRAAVPTCMRLHNFIIGWRLDNDHCGWIAEAAKCRGAGVAAKIPLFPPRGHDPRVDIFRSWMNLVGKDLVWNTAQRHVVWVSQIQGGAQFEPLLNRISSERGRESRVPADLLVWYGIDMT